MRIEPGDRFLPVDATRNRAWKSVKRLASIAVVLAAGAGLAFYRQDVSRLVTAFFAPPPPPASAFRDVYAALHVAAPGYELDYVPAIAQGLEKLRQEPCDNMAIYGATEALIKQNEQRLAANMLEGFAARCANGSGNLRRAADLFIQIGDDRKALTLTQALVQKYPDNSDLWYLNGKAQVALQMYDAALESYANAIRLHNPTSPLGEWVYTEMAEIYAALHRYCDAVDPLLSWTAASPDAHADARIGTLIENYQRMGQCRANATGSEIFRASSGKMIRVRAEINGVPGTFLVDTGATMVSIDEAFAAKAGLTSQSTKAGKVQTANGVVDVHFATARTVKAGHAQAENVAIAVVDHQAFGEGTEGLLGMSFLSRFDISIKPGIVQISPRTRGTADKSR